MTGRPAKTRRTKASELANLDGEYWLQVSDDEGSPWKLVRQRATNAKYPSPLSPEEVAALGKRAAYLPETVKVTFADGDIRVLNPDDPVEYGVECD
jgi:hypothetical protein